MSAQSLLVGTVLQSLGLTDAETRVYTALLGLGSQPASIAAKKANLKRGHTYNVLTELAERGLVQEFERAGVRYFTAAEPQALVSILKNRQEDLDRQKRDLLSVLPELEHLKNPMLVAPKVRFFQGVEGIRAIYEETIQTKDETIYALGDFEHFFPLENDPDLNEWMWQYSLRRAKKGIWYYGILNRSKTSDMAYKTRVAQKRKLKMLTGVDLSVEVNIVGNKVAIMSSSKDMVGLIIEDQPTADTLRNFHRAIWTVLPEYSAARI